MSATLRLSRPADKGRIQEDANIMRTALVGGGAGGIGYAIAERLARSGDRVVITGRHADALEAAVARLCRAGEDSSAQAVHALVSDMADPASAAAAMEEVDDRYGGLDVLVLNSGGPPPGGILELDDSRWHEASELLLLGPLRLARLAMPAMAKRGFGRVVFVTSTAVRQPQPDLAASVVLRSAVTAAAKLLSLEFAAEGVTVNCVAPGATATERRTQILQNRARAASLGFDELDAQDLAHIPAGRAARPAEIAGAVAFLASDDAAYINGTVLTVDGGRTETI